MTTVIIKMEKHPRVARILANKEIKKGPIPIPEKDLISLEEFKKNFEDAILEDLGLKISL